MHSTPVVAREGRIQPAWWLISGVLNPELLRGKKGGRIGGKRSLETMTPEERTARAKKASLAAAKKRTAERIARSKER